MTTENKSAFSAAIARDPAIDSNVITLTYHDSTNPSHSLTVSIAPELGSNLFRFRVGEHNIIYCDQELLKQKGFTGNFVLWPFPNRVRDKRYTYQGHNYSLEEVKRRSGNAVLIHGLVLDRIWSYDQPMLREDAVSVTTSVAMTTESPFYASYPFPSRLSLTYTLTKAGLSITYLVQNNGTTDLPFGFALHPYFSTLSGKDDTFVRIPAPAVMEADSELLPTGRVLDIDTIMYAMFDLRQPVPVSNLKLDHVYTGVQQSGHAMIEYRKQAMELHITATDDFTHIVIYTPESDEPFFCLEHQTCSTDAINFHNQGPERQALAHLLEVRPQESYTGTLQYTVNFT